MSARVARRSLARLALVALVAIAGCAAPTYRDSAPPSDVVRAGSVLGAYNIDGELERRILALDPDNVSDRDVREVLARAPTPQILLLHGGVYPVHLAMTSFAKFLIGMGYPQNRVRHPGDGRYSHSPYEDSAQIAGLVAWYYEHEGTRVMLVGHSQGGIQAIKVLDELAGRLSSDIKVWNPFTDTAEDRDTIVDPLTGQRRPVVGITVAYASAVGAGGAALLLPNQWNMATRLRTVPNTVDDFTGYTIGVDLVAWSFGGDPASEFHSGGKASVRNVVLPASYNHVIVPVSAHLARDPRIRAWIDAYRPGEDERPIPEGDTLNLLWAADVWYSIKKHWCLEAQHVVQARRAALAQSN